MIRSVGTDCWAVDPKRPDALEAALAWGRRRRARGEGSRFIILGDGWVERLHAWALAMAQLEPTEFSPEVGRAVEEVSVLRQRRSVIRRQLRLEGFAVS